jgi:hypothetical protein
MNDMVVVDTLRELTAQDERRQVALLTMGMALLMQQRNMVLGALLAQGDQWAQPDIVVKRR